MGLLDMLGNLSPDQTQGLLSAGANMLQNSGPSRTPVGLGAIIGGGIDTFQQSTLAAKKRKAEEEQAAQMAQLRGLQIQEGQGSLQDSATRRQSAADLIELNKRFTMDGPQATTGQPSQGIASAMPGIGGNPRLGGPDWLQTYQQQAPASAPLAPQGSQPSGAEPSPYDYAVAHSKFLIKNGRVAEGLAEAEKAQSMRPRYSTDFREGRGADGQMHNYVLGDDGTWKDTGIGVKPNMTEVDLGGSKRFVDKNNVVNGQSFARTMTPGEVASDRNSRNRLAFDQRQAEAPEAAIGADAITNAAARYNIDGTLPPMGMGKAAAAGRSAILNKAAEMKFGVDPEQQRRDQVNFKGDTAARNSALRDYSSGGKSGQAIQAANTALNHMDTVERLALAQKNGNVRLFNQLANKLGAEFGATAPTNLAAALSMVAPEVSKSVIGVAGTGEERANFEKKFTGNGSDAQAIGGMGVIKELLGGRLTESQRTYERTTGNKDFRDKMLSPAAQAVLDRAHGGAASAGPKVATLADITETARKSGKTTEEVTKALRAKGYTIGGQ